MNFALVDFPDTVDNSDDAVRPQADCRCGEQGPLSIVVLAVREDRK